MIPGVVGAGIWGESPCWPTFPAHCDRRGAIRELHAAGPETESVGKLADC